ncbi:hypothetical protein LCGC14_0332120 [marine sediment metagenome]|uniref:Phosphoadenosine phosphosulphate reductase domain-containing protein n=1 Tax=marine sediment metagenome TaxID=412755 RepID=A0A0F9WNK1_9ZZZZ
MPKSQPITRAIDPTEYDHIIVGFSGGKDSLACVLKLLREYPEVKDKIELWHHDIDGREGSELMDWAITPDYCRAVAEALDLPIYFQWKVGGFEGEMLRENETTKGVKYEARDGSDEICYLAPGKSGKAGTRRKFPQVSADLSVRWCSAYLKIDVARRVINAEFKGELDQQVKVLLVTGERAEESTARANYNTAEVINSTRRREVHQWRAIHQWTEQQVWDITKDFSINPHPCYHLGWGRASCLACIFGNKDQWASVRALDPQRFEKVAGYEAEFETTIQRKLSIREQADRGAVFEQITSEDHQREIAVGKHYPRDEVIISDWKLPAGAYRACGGPV